jgi:hypothetical protein
LGNEPDTIPFLKNAPPFKTVPYFTPIFQKKHTFAPLFLKKQGEKEEKQLYHTFCAP